MIRQRQKQSDKKKSKANRNNWGVQPRRHVFFLCHPSNMGEVRLQATTMLVAQRTEKYDNLANSAARRVSPDETKKFNTKFEQQEKPHLWRHEVRGTVPDEVCSDMTCRPVTVVRYTGLHHLVTRSDCVLRGIRPLPCLGDGKPYKRRSPAKKLHCLDKLEIGTSCHRKPTRRRGVLPPQHEHEAGRRVAEHQASGKVHQRERAELLRDCDSYSFFYMNITTGSGFQEHAASWNSGSKFETNLRLGPEDLVQHLASREEAEFDRILIWMFDMQNMDRNSHTC